MQRLSLFSLSLLAAFAVGCGDDKGGSGTDGGSTGSPTTSAGTTGGGTDGTGGGTGGSSGETPTTSAGSSGGNDTAADGEPCMANADCMSLSCVKFTDNQTDAVCEAAPDGGNTRFTGTIFHFVTGAAVPGAQLRVVEALSAIQDPMNAMGLVTATSDAMGQIDVTTTTPLSGGLGMVGLVDGGEFFVTATGLASPTAGKYGPLSSIHDIWGVPSASLTEWSGYLMTDPDMTVQAALPLGTNGGVIGLVRQAGAPLSGAVVKPEKDTSSAVVRYLNDDGMGFGTAMTGTSGIFVLLNPGLAEKFTVEVGGTPTGLSGTAGSAMNAAFVLIFNVP